jgi:hypothetical protein
MVSVLAIEPKVRGFKSGRGDGFFRAIEIRSTSSMGGEVKLSAPCSKILRHVKKSLANMNKSTSQGQIPTLPSNIPPAFYKMTLLV